MPTYSFNINDLNRLLVKPTTPKELEETLPLMAVPVEHIDGDEISIEVFANRPDMLGVEGLARTFAGFTNRDLTLPIYSPEGTTPQKLIIAPEMQSYRPYIVMAYVTNFKADDMALQAIFKFHEKLDVTYARNRRKVSIGLYDVKTAGLEAPITFKLMKKSDVRFIPLGEQHEMTASEILDNTPKGKDYAHLVPGEYIPVLLDKNGTLLSIPPILNGQSSEVTENTTEMFVDCTATDWNAMISIFNMVLTGLADRGAKIHPFILEYPYDTPAGRTVQVPDFKPQKMTLDTAYVDKKLGKQVSYPEQICCLKASRMGVKELKKGLLELTVPCYRTDIMHSVDLVEEIAITHGYSNFSPTLPPVATTGEESIWQVFRRRLANLFVGCGGLETMSYMLTNEQKLFTNMNLEIDHKTVVVLSNPMTNLTTVCRHWLLPSLLEVLATNKKYNYPQRLFEICTISVINDNTETGTQDMWHACFVEAGVDCNFNTIAAIFYTLKQNLDLDITIKRPIEDKPYLLNGRSGDIMFQGQKIGFLGEIHPSVLHNWELTVPVVCMEIELHPLLIAIRQFLGLQG